MLSGFMSVMKFENEVLFVAPTVINSIRGLLK
jgi:hypothetical protein